MDTDRYALPLGLLQGACPQHLHWPPQCMHPVSAEKLVSHRVQVGTPSDGEISCIDQQWQNAAA